MVAHPTTRRARGLSCVRTRVVGARSRGGGFHALPSVRPDRAAGVGGGLRLLADGGRPLRGHRGRRGDPGDPPRARPGRELRRHRAGLRGGPLRGSGRPRARDPAQGRDPGHQVRGEGPPAGPARAATGREPRQHPARSRREPEAPAHRLGGRAARALARRVHPVRGHDARPRRGGGLRPRALRRRLQLHRRDAGGVWAHPTRGRLAGGLPHARPAPGARDLPPLPPRGHRGDGLRLARPRSPDRSLHPRHHLSRRGATGARPASPSGSRSSGARTSRPTWGWWTASAARSRSPGAPR